MLGLQPAGPPGLREVKATAAPTLPGAAMNTPPPPRSRRANAAQTSTVTLQQVAERAGVSPSTVRASSMALAVVSLAKQAAVQAAIQELGFRPNPWRAAWRAAKPSALAWSRRPSPAFYGEAMYGIEGVLDAAGYASLFVSGNWREDDERKAIETLMSRRVDGLIVFAGRLPDAALKRYAAEVPLVLVGRRSPGRQFLSIGFDNRLGAHLAAEHLLSLGHRQIAFITGAHQHADALERRAGFEETLQAAGLKLDPTWWPKAPTPNPAASRRRRPFSRAASPSRRCLRPTTRWPLAPRWPCTGPACACRRMSRSSALMTWPWPSSPSAADHRAPVGGRDRRQAATALFDLLADRRRASP